MCSVIIQRMVALFLYTDLYPRAMKFTRILGARGHIRAINLAKHNVREYKKRSELWKEGGRAYEKSVVMAE